MAGLSLRHGALCLAFLVAAPVVAHDRAPAPAAETGALGDTTFPNSGSVAAQPEFLRGLLLLHSFEFDAARKAFRAASAADPAFVMAFWGEALTHNMPLWGEQDLSAARAALTRLAPTREERLAKAPTERERGYLAAVEALYGDGDKAARDAAYNEALGALVARNPDDLDARSFYALSWLALTGATRDTANYMRGAAEAEAVYEVNKHHPGALHYLVHAYDDPVHAPLGLRAARLYGKVAPAAAHAQHMPSHIFFALGMWDDAVEANVAALATERGQGRGGYHPLEWLSYAYLQQGRLDDAANLLRLLEEDVARDPSQASRSALAYDRAVWIAETGGAAGVDGWGDVDEKGIASIYPFTAHDFARGVAAARAGRTDEAVGYARRLRDRGTAARAHAVGVVASRYDTVTPEELAQTGLLADALDGAIRFTRGEQEAGVAQLRAAIATSESMAFEYGPPFSAKPLNELLGDLLLGAGKPAEAIAAYDKSLAMHPKRKLSKEGLVAARAAAWSCKHCEKPADEAAPGG